jgi:hypothetical protein
MFTGCCRKSPQEVIMALRNSIDFASVCLYKYVSFHPFTPRIHKRGGIIMIAYSLRKNLLLGGLLLLLGPYVLSGCAANVTRSLPVTQVRPSMVDIAPSLKSSRLGIVLFAHKDTKIEGGHHEGLLQVRQPWIFGISKAQKDMLYGNAGELAALSFASELKYQGLSVTLLQDTREASSNNSDLLVTGKVERVILNTYGHGTKVRIWFSGKLLGSNGILFQHQANRYAITKGLSCWGYSELCEAEELSCTIGLDHANRSRQILKGGITALPDPDGLQPSHGSLQREEVRRDI